MRKPLTIQGICNQIEKRIQRDEGQRGIAALVEPGELYRAAHHASKAKNVKYHTKCYRRLKYAKDSAPVDMKLLLYSGCYHHRFPLFDG